jgi:hypothetical protein
LPGRIDEWDARTELYRRLTRQGVLVDNAKRAEAAGNGDWVRYVPGRLPDEARRDAVYAGELLVFTAIPPMRELCVLTDGLIREALDVPDPERAQSRLDSVELTARTAALRRRFGAHPDVRRLFVATLAYVGVDLDHTYWDRLQVRMVPTDDPPVAGRLGVHRDTWSSNVYAQTNWWAPVYPITPERGLAVYPDYWSRPLANDSADWDLNDVLARRRAGAVVALVPSPTEPVDDAAELRVAIDPGDLLCFSGAHLHVGVPNYTGVARFSIDTRTVDAEDFAAGRGAPNVDGAAPRIARDWFRPIAGETPLG